MNDAVSAKLLEDEVRNLSAKVKELQSKKTELESKLEERAESYARVSDRLLQSKEEIRSREHELAKIQSRILAAQEKQEKLFDQDGERGSSCVMLKSEDIPSTQDAYLALREQMESIGEIIGVQPVGVSTSLSSVASDAVMHVTIEHDDDACGFRVTSTYTFKQLTDDACRHWGVDPFDHTLRDSSNSLWPMHGNVREVLTEEIRKMNKNDIVHVALPKVRLVGNGKSKSRGALAIVDGTSISQRRKAGNGEMSYEQDFLEKLLLNEEAMSRKRKKNKHKKKTRKARALAAGTLSEFFHDPVERAAIRHGATEGVFRPVESFGEERRAEDSNELEYRKRTKFTGICLKIFFWLGFVVLLCSAAAIRYNPPVSFSSAASMQKKFLHGFPMSEPLLFTDPAVSARWLFSTLDQDIGILTGSNLRRFPLAQLNDYWNFMETIVLPLIFSEGGNSTTNDMLISDTQIMITPLLVRQNRVRNNSCLVNPVYSDAVKNDLCFGPYAAKYSETGTFGGGNFTDSTPTASPTPSPTSNGTASPTSSPTSGCDCINQQWCKDIVSNAFQYTQVPGPLTIGHYGTYDSSGYYTLIESETTLSDALCAVETLKELDWVGQSTRGLEIMMAVYNSNLHSIIGITILIELGNSGSMAADITYSRMGLSLYDTYASSGLGLNPFLVAADAYSFIYVSFLVYICCLDIIVYGALRTFTTVWNLVVLLVSVLFYAGLGLRVVYEVKVSTYRTNLVNLVSQNGILKVDAISKLRGMLSLYSANMWIDSLTCVFAIMLVFKFTQANRRISVIFETVYRSTKFAASLLFLLFLLLYTTSVVAFLVYGVKFGEWRTYEGALFEMMRLISGEILYFQYRDADLFFTPFFFLFFMIFFIFMGISSITAIYIDAYFEVSSAGLQKARPTRFWTALLVAPFCMCSKRHSAHTARVQKKDE